MKAIFFYYFNFRRRTPVRLKRFHDGGVTQNNMEATNRLHGVHESSFDAYKKLITIINTNHTDMIS